MPLVAWSPSTQCLSSSRSSDPRRQGQGPSPHRRLRPSKDQLVDALLPFVFGCQSASTAAARPASTGQDSKSRLKHLGGADRNRTDDIQLAKLALYQLSYSR